MCGCGTLWVYVWVWVCLWQLCARTQACAHLRAHARALDGACTCRRLCSRGVACAQSTSDAALDTLAAILDAQGDRAAAIKAFNLQHTVLRDRGHAWLCPACAVAVAGH